MTKGKVGPARNFLGKVADGLHIELIRDGIKWLVVLVGGTLVSAIVTGMLNFDFSLRSFNLFGKTNSVTHANQTIRPNAVWELPQNTVVRVKNGGYFTYRDSWSEYYDLAYTGTTGERVSNDRVAPGSALMVTEDCVTRSFQPMTAPERGEPMLLLYTEQYETDCSE